MQHVGIQHTQGSQPNNNSMHYNHAEISSNIPAGNSTTSILRNYRKKEVAEKLPLDASNGLENQGPVARVAPHAHYPKPTNEIYRYPQHYGEFNMQTGATGAPPPVKYSEIIEQPMQAIDHHLGHMVQKPKEKTYLEMCNQSHMKAYSENYFGMRNVNPMAYKQQFPVNHHYMQKESQISPGYPQKDLSYMANYKMPPTQYPRYPRESNEFLSNLNKIAPDMAQEILNDPHLREQQFPMYLEQNRLYSQSHQRMYQRTSPIHPNPNFNQRNVNYNQYQMNQPRLQENYRFYQPQGNLRYQQIDQNMQRYEGLYPSRISPNFPPCSQLEYSQHYQHRQMPVRQDFLQIPGKNFLESHPEIPEIIPDEAIAPQGKSLKTFLENWNEETFTEDSENAEKPPAKENTLYVLDAMEIPSENIPQYIHLQSIDKLPPNIRGFYTEGGDQSVVIKKDDSVKSPESDDRPACKLLQNIALNSQAKQNFEEAYLKNPPVLHIPEQPLKSLPILVHEEEDAPEKPQPNPNDPETNSRDGKEEPPKPKPEEPKPIVKTESKKDDIFDSSSERLKPNKSIRITDPIRKNISRYKEKKTQEADSTIICLGDDLKTTLEEDLEPADHPIILEMHKELDDAIERIRNKSRRSSEASELCTEEILGRKSVITENTFEEIPFDYDDERKITKITNEGLSEDLKDSPMDLSKPEEPQQITDGETPTQPTEDSKDNTEYIPKSVCDDLDITSEDIEDLERLANESDDSSKETDEEAYSSCGSSQYSEDSCEDNQEFFRERIDDPEISKTTTKEEIPEDAEASPLEKSEEGTEEVGLIEDVGEKLSESVEKIEEASNSLDKSEETLLEPLMEEKSCGGSFEEAGVENEAKEELAGNSEEVRDDLEEATKPENSIAEVEVEAPSSNPPETFPGDDPKSPYPVVDPVDEKSSPPEDEPVDESPPLRNPEETCEEKDVETEIKDLMEDLPENSADFSSNADNVEETTESPEEDSPAAHIDLHEENVITEEPQSPTPEEGLIEETPEEDVRVVIEETPIIMEETTLQERKIDGEMSVDIDQTDVALDPTSFVLEIASELLQINVSRDENGEKVISVTPLTKVRVVANEERPQSDEEAEETPEGNVDVNENIIEPAQEDECKLGEEEIVEGESRVACCEVVDHTEDVIVEDFKEGVVQTQNVDDTPPHLTAEKENWTQEDLPQNEVVVENTEDIDSDGTMPVLEPMVVSQDNLEKDLLIETTEEKLILEECSIVEDLLEEQPKETTDEQPLRKFKRETTKSMKQGKLKRKLLNSKFPTSRKKMVKKDFVMKPRKVEGNPAKPDDDRTTKKPKKSKIILDEKPKPMTNYKIPKRDEKPPDSEPIKPEETPNSLRKFRRIKAFKDQDDEEPHTDTKSVSNEEEITPTTPTTPTTPEDTTPREETKIITKKKVQFDLTNKTEVDSWKPNPERMKSCLKVKKYHPNGLVRQEILKRSYLDEQNKRKRLSLQEYNTRKKRVRSEKPEETFQYGLPVTGLDFESAKLQEEIEEEVLKNLTSPNHEREEVPLEETEEPKRARSITSLKLLERSEFEEEEDSWRSPAEEEEEKPRAYVDKSVVEEKLNSLEEFLPKVAKIGRTSISQQIEDIFSEKPIYEQRNYDKVLIDRFVKHETLRPDELQKVRDIIEKKKLLKINEVTKRRHSGDVNSKTVSIDFNDFDIKKPTVEERRREEVIFRSEDRQDPEGIEPLEDSTEEEKTILSKTKAQLKLFEDHFKELADEENDPSRDEDFVETRIVDPPEASPTQPSEAEEIAEILQGDSASQPTEIKTIEDPDDKEETLQNIREHINCYDSANSQKSEEDSTRQEDHAFKQPQNLEPTVEEEPKIQEMKKPDNQNLSKVKAIIEIYKRALQQPNNREKVKKIEELIEKVTNGNLKKIQNAINPALLVKANQKFRSNVYEIDHQSSVENPIKIHLKKVPEEKKKRRKRFRNLYSGNDTDDEVQPKVKEMRFNSERTGSVGDYAVVQRDGTGGVPKLVIKLRKTDCRVNLQPYVKLPRMPYVENMVKRKKRTVVLC